MKCNLNYQSLYAFVNNTQMHIDDLIKSTDEKIKQKIKCINGHELIFANGKKNKPHFRHKNIEDMDTQPMTEWHSEWQGNFPITEIDFNALLKAKLTANKVNKDNNKRALKKPMLSSHTSDISSKGLASIINVNCLPPKVVIGFSTFGC